MAIQFLNFNLTDSLFYYLLLHSPRTVLHLRLILSSPYPSPKLETSEEIAFYTYALISCRLVLLKHLLSFFLFVEAYFACRFYYRLGRLFTTCASTVCNLVNSVIIDSNRLNLWSGFLFLSPNNNGHCGKFHNNLKIIITCNAMFYVQTYM